MWVDDAEVITYFPKREVGKIRLSKSKKLLG